MTLHPPHGLVPRAIIAVTGLWLAALPGGLRTAGTAQAATLIAPDHVTVTTAGYRLDADVATGGISVTDDPGSYSTSAITGHATLPGRRGGSASIDVHITSG